MTTIIDRPDLLLTVEREGDVVRLTAQMPMIGQTVTIGLEVVEADDLARQLMIAVDEIA